MSREQGGGERVKGLRIEWVSLAVDVAIMCVAISACEIFLCWGLLRDVQNKPSERQCED